MMHRFSHRKGTLVLTPQFQAATMADKNMGANAVLNVSWLNVFFSRQKHIWQNFWDEILTCFANKRDEGKRLWRVSGFLVCPSGSFRFSVLGCLNCSNFVVWMLVNIFTGFSNTFYMCNACVANCLGSWLAIPPHTFQSLGHNTRTHLTTTPTWRSPFCFESLRIHVTYMPPVHTPCVPLDHWIHGYLLVVVSGT